MEYGYSIIMGVFSGALLLYAGLMFLTGDYDLIPTRARQSVKPKDPKRYMRQFAKVLALVALSPGLSALAGLWNMIAAMIVLIVVFILAIVLGVKIMKKSGQDD